MHIYIMHFWYDINWAIENKIASTCGLDEDLVLFPINWFEKLTVKI